MTQTHTASKVLAGTVGALGLFVVSTQAANADTVTVKNSDTVWSLAKHYGVSVKSIEKANGIKQLDESTDLIFSGQKLKIGQHVQSTKTTTSKTTSKTATNATTGNTYTVKAGDSLWAIANQNHITVAELLKANGIESGDVILPGQKLALTGTSKKAVNDPTSAAASKVAHTSAATHASVSAKSTLQSQKSSQAPQSAASTSQASANTTSKTTATSVSQATATKQSKTESTSAASSTTAKTEVKAAQTQSTTSATSQAPQQSAQTQKTSVAPKAVAQPATSTSSQATSSAAQSTASAAPKQSQQAQSTASAAPKQSQQAQSTASAAPKQSQQAQSTASAAPKQSQQAQSVANSAAPAQSQQAKSQQTQNTSTAPASQASASQATNQSQANQANANSQKAQASTNANLSSGSVTGLAASLTHANIPYVWGGSSLSGMDCSGFVAYVFQHAAGKSLPHSTTALEGAVSQHSVQDAKPGDLLFWGSKGATYHVGIYLGNNTFAAAPQPGQNVETETINAAFMPSFAGTVN